MPVVVSVPQMKKSYHSKIVPSDDALITSRMSCGVGSAPGIASAIVAMVPLPGVSPTLAGCRRPARGARALRRPPQALINVAVELLAYFWAMGIALRQA